MNPVDMNDLVDAHSVSVYRFCLRLAGNRQDAEELFQQTFLKAVELSRRIDRERNPLGLLLAIAARTHRRNFVKAGRRQRILPRTDNTAEGENLIDTVPDQCDVEADADKRELARAVRAQVQALPDKFREVVVMYYTGGQSVEQIAAAMNLRQGTVKSRLYKARQTIRAGLEAKGYGQEAF